MAMRSLARYRAWALREPFTLWVTDTEFLSIDRPDPDTLLQYAAADTHAAQLRLLAGPAAGKVLEVLGDEDAAVLTELVRDMSAWFGCENSRRFVTLVERYGDEIAADLADLFGVELLEVFTGERLPDEVLAKIDRLPRHSRLSDALQQDDELAAQMSDTQVGEAAATVTFTEWTPETERLTVIANSLGAIYSAICSIGGSKDQLPSLPGPKGAAERYAERLLDEEFSDLVADVEAARQRGRDQQT